jgi:hypothetical protein
MRLRHFVGHSLVTVAHFDRTLFRPVEDYGFVKPSGGLWTSPIDCENGWETEGAEMFGPEAVAHWFDIEFTGNCLTIDSLADLDKLDYRHFADGLHSRFPIFEPLLAAGVDAIHLTWRGQCETRLSFPRNLYGWDCESVFIMNPDTITPITL